MGYGGWPIIPRRINITEGYIYSDRDVGSATFIQLAINVHRVHSVTVPSDRINAL